MKIFDSIEKLIGNTPILRAKNIEEEENLFSEILLKLEMFNPAGSVKDRVALSMIKDALNKGLISAGATIIEPTSGNTGIGIASLCASLGYKAILTMPDTMSEERIQLLKAYGAEVVLTNGECGMAGAIEKAEELNSEIQNSIILGQFENDSNPLVHYQTTGREIYEDTDGKVDIFIAGIGTGGTISGIAKYLKEKNKDILIVGVEPADSPLLTENRAGKHQIQGIGANFLPKNLDLSLIDKIETVSTEEAFKYAKMVARKEGILVGISSGAVLSVAVKLAKKKENISKKIVVLMPDNGDRYISTGVFK